MNYDRQFTSFCAIFAPYLKDVSPKQGYDAICAFFGYVTTGEEQENGLKGAALLLYHVIIYAGSTLMNSNVLDSPKQTTEQKSLLE